MTPLVVVSYTRENTRTARLLRFILTDYWKCLRLLDIYWTKLLEITSDLTLSIACISCCLGEIFQLSQCLATDGSSTRLSLFYFNLQCVCVCGMREGGREGRRQDECGQKKAQSLHTPIFLWFHENVFGRLFQPFLYSWKWQIQNL